MTRDDLASQIIGRYLEEGNASTVETGADSSGGLGTELAALFPRRSPDLILESPFDSRPKDRRRRPVPT